MAKKSEETNEQKSQNTQQINVLGQYIKDVSFEAPNTPALFKEMKKSPEVSVNVDLQASKQDEDIYEVTLHVRTEAKIDDKVCFLCEVTYGALSKVICDPKVLEPILLIEIPRIIFPFVRNIIGDMTRESGFPPLWINPIDFVGMYNQRAEQLAKRAKEEAKA